MSSTKHSIKLIAKNGSNLTVDQDCTSPFVGLELRRNDPKDIVDYTGASESLANVATLEVETPRDMSCSLEVMLGWPQHADPPTITPIPSSPPIDVQHATNKKQTLLTFPVPPCVETWHIWNDLNDQTPGFDLKVKVKRK